MCKIGKRLILYGRFGGVKRKGERKKVDDRGGSWHDGINLFIYSAGAGGDPQPA